MRHRNYRVFFWGQLFSVPGNNIQMIAQAWLVLQLTDSGTVVGLVTGAQFVPVLLLGAYGGVLVDRFDNRLVMYVTQSLSGAAALFLGVVVVASVVELWMVFVAAALSGVAMAADSPARQSYVSEMVPPEDVALAVTSNMLLINAARIAGPAAAAALIAGAGVGVCFLVNAASYVAAIAGLALIRGSDLYVRPRAVRAPRAILSGIEHVRQRPVLSRTLIMLALAGGLQGGTAVVMPLLAARTFSADATTYAYFSVWMGIGALFGGVLLAKWLTPGRRTLMWISAFWAVATVLASLAPTVATMKAAMALIGAANLLFTTQANATLQANSYPQMRGRVMSLWSVTFLGASAFAGPLFGVLTDMSGPRSTLAAAAVLAVAMFLVGAERRRPAEAVASDSVEGLPLDLAPTAHPIQSDPTAQNLPLGRPSP